MFSGQFVQRVQDVGPRRNQSLCGTPGYRRRDVYLCTSRNDSSARSGRSPARRTVRFLFHGHEIWLMGSFCRYCNMDYIAFSAIQTQTSIVKRLFFSYDIWCQWSIHLMERMGKLPEALRLPDDLVPEGGIPKCHSPGHQLGCQCKYCMNIQPGIGRTDGEGIERTWSGINASAPATKEMLPGGRHDMLDRRFGAHNWEKLTRLGEFSLF